MRTSRKKDKVANNITNTTMKEGRGLVSPSSQKEEEYKAVVSACLHG